MSVKQRKRKKTAVVLMSSEIALKAVEEVLEKLGYEIRHDVDSCVHADFAVVGAYFLRLGVTNQIHSTNLKLPLVLVISHEDEVSGNDGMFYDVLELNSSSQMEACEKMTRWFSEGAGRFLVSR